MGVSSGDLRSLPEGRAQGQASDLERVLRQHRLSSEVCDPLAEWSATKKWKGARAAARTDLQPRNTGSADRCLGSGWVSLVGATESAVAAAAVGGYLASFDALTRLAEKKKEALIEALCR